MIFHGGCFVCASCAYVRVRFLCAVALSTHGFGSYKTCSVYATSTRSWVVPCSGASYSYPYPGQDTLDFVGLDYSKMERACSVADYDHTGRTYWETTSGDVQANICFPLRCFSLPHQDWVDGMNHDQLRCETSLIGRCTMRSADHLQWGHQG